MTELVDVEDHHSARWMHPPVDHNSARWMHPPPGDGNREDSFVVAPDGLHLLDAAAGRLKRGYNMDGYVSNQLDYLELFPFDLDAMDLRLYTESNWETPSACESGMSPKHRLYRLLPVVPDTGEGNFWWFGWDGSIEEFTLHGYSYFIEEHAATASGALGTSVHLKFHVSRRPDFYLTKVITPLIMLWQMQAWTFFLDDDDLPKRIAHVSTLLLTACAMVYVVSGFLPKLAFLTEIDRTMQALFVTIVCNGWLEIVAHTVRQRHPRACMTFSRWCGLLRISSSSRIFSGAAMSCHIEFRRRPDVSSTAECSPPRKLILVSATPCTVLVMGGTRRHQRCAAGLARRRS
jgi:hypothetical protein